MANRKAPERVNDSGRPESEGISDLVEIAKRSSEFKKDYGATLGALLMAWMGHLATRSRPPIVRSGWLLALGSVIFGAWKFLFS